jgi:hypothetical protein
LAAAGHDLRALDQELALEGLDDEEVLALATTERRVLITHNVRDFPAILRDWAGTQRSHAGVILIYGIDHREFDAIVRGVELCLNQYGDSENWRDLAVVVNREFAAGA